MPNFIEQTFTKLAQDSSWSLTQFSNSLYQCVTVRQNDKLFFAFSNKDNMVAEGTFGLDAQNKLKIQVESSLFPENMQLGMLNTLLLTMQQTEQIQNKSTQLKP